jgi:hypothetical protein
VGCGHWEKVVHVVQTYDCHAGFKNLGVFRWLDGFDDWMVGFFVPDGKSLLGMSWMSWAGPCIMAIYEWIEFLR